MLAALKNRYRRWQLSRRGITPEIDVATFTAGDRSGVWTVASELLDANSIVYSFGAGDNVSWDLAMIERFGVTIHAFDPTPVSIAWVAEQDLPPQFRFHPMGLAAYDGTLRLARRHEGRFNFRPIAYVAKANADVCEAPVARLTTLMQRLGHERIDLLKMDIEGGEYDVLDDLLTSRIDVRQLLVEFHHHFPTIGINRTIAMVERLTAAGFRVFNLSERGLEISLVQHRFASEGRRTALASALG
jgi:FkbM family methyltransferase